jgi:hypothetical protein
MTACGPPMDPDTSRATPEQLDLARRQGDAYRLRVRVEPPTFMRHDEVNGRRFTSPVEVESDDVAVKRGQD